MKTTPEIRAMNGIELAIRRVSDRLKSRRPWDMGATEALDELAEELSRMSEQAVQAANETPASV
jgi:signal transduction histidine kinase